MPRTPWGDPDLQGTWDYRTITPLERNREFGTREFYTEEEKKTLEDRAGRRMDTPPEEIRPGLNHAQWWTDPGRFISDGYRTSLIVDPPDGRIPALTAEGRARQGRAPNRNNAVNASWLDRGNQERCITYGLPSASLPTLYNNNIQIVQAPGTAVIVHEMIHEARVVPLDGRPRLNENVRAWIGDSRGHWEGERSSSRRRISTARTATADRRPVCIWSNAIRASMKAGWSSGSRSATRRHGSGRGRCCCPCGRPKVS